MDVSHGDRHLYFIPEMGGWNQKSEIGAGPNIWKAISNAFFSAARKEMVAYAKKLKEILVY